MATTIEVSIPNMEAVLAKLNGIKPLKFMRERMKQAAEIVELEAKKEAPKDTGNLARSITNEVREAGTEITGVIGVFGADAGTTGFYAACQEFGFAQHFVPASIIGLWAQRHGLGYTGLMVSGEPKMYLHGAIETKMSSVQAQLNKVLDDIKGVWEG